MSDGGGIKARRGGLAAAKASQSTAAGFEGQWPGVEVDPRRRPAPNGDDGGQACMAGRKQLSGAAARVGGAWAGPNAKAKGGLVELAWSTEPSEDHANGRRAAGHWVELASRWSTEDHRITAACGPAALEVTVTPGRKHCVTAVSPELPPRHRLAGVRRVPIPATASPGPGSISSPKAEAVPG